MKKSYILLILLALMCSSCKVFMPTRLVHAKKSDLSPIPEDDRFAVYRIAPNDVLSLAVYVQNGENIFENNENSNNNHNNRNYYDLTVDYDGTLKVPGLRKEDSTKRIYVAGLTIQELEDWLEIEYSKYMNSPMVIITGNHQVYVFQGEDGNKAKLITLRKPYTTVFEALAEAGGISDGKGYNIKVIRGNLRNPTVYKVDLSTIQGLRETNLTVQANDIIYVEPRLKPVSRFLKEASPYINLGNTILSIINTVEIFKRIR